MTPELIKNCLYGLNAFLAGVIAIAFTAFCRPGLLQKDKYLSIAIGVVSAFLVALVTDAAQNPQINDKTYIILVVGFCFCLGSIAFFWKAWDTESPPDDRTILLGFVRREVSNRLQAMGVLSKYIPGRVNPKVESQDDRNSSSGLSSGIFKGIFSKVKVLFGGKEEVVLPGMAIADIFNQDTAKELLILGAPGGGKTTALLTLAMQLCEEAEQNRGKPIPIVLELSSWQPAEEIPHWIALQLKAKYQLSEATCQEYLKGGRFVLLLDGLDELKNDKDACLDERKNDRDDCIEAINQFRTKRDYEFQQVVVCSRLIDYEETTKKLQISRAYCLLELNDAEIKSYLTDPTPPALVSPLWAKLKADPNGFLKLARQPLLLDLIRKTYTDGLLPFPELTTNSDPEQYKRDCQEHLLADYVEHQLEENHDHRGYDPRKTKHYLEWLAQNLKRKTTTEFLLENMQPSWLEPDRQKGYRIATGLILGLILGLIVGLIIGLIDGLQGNLRLRENPNEGIWKSGQNALIITVSYLFICALVTLPYLAANRSINLPSVFPTSIGISLFAAIIYSSGGLPFIQHFVLRYFLIRAGHIPKDYVGFLKYAEERGLILQNGGSFRFYHDLLREHLAGNTPPPPLTKKSSNDWLQRSGISILVILLFAALMSVSIIISPISSTSPAIQHQDTIVLDRITARYRSFGRGNIVIFNVPESLSKQGFENAQYYRRIVGLPQETVEIKEGKVYVNNQLLTAPYAQAPLACTYAPTLIPADHYFVMGNNPAFPDCNTYAALVPKANITGQALWRLFPPNRFGQIE